MGMIESLVEMGLGEVKRDVVIKKEESFIKDYPTIKTFFESQEFMQICKANKDFVERH